MESAHSVLITLASLVLASGGLTLSVVGTLLSLLGVKPHPVEYRSRHHKVIPLRPQVQRLSTSGSESIPDLIPDEDTLDDSNSESSSILTVSTAPSRGSLEMKPTADEAVVVPVEEPATLPRRPATPLTPSFTRFKGLARCIHAEKSTSSFLRRSSTVSSFESIGA
ncbi:hypothetical protein PQX77_001931 [Marasmius sp. AFHP31]|nr:hypothetical protein PQX77_001931 [Marasmius sp. AFHP31]